MRQALMLAYRMNRRKLWVCLAIMAGCVAAVLAFGSPFDAAPQSLASFFALGVVAIITAWLTVRLARENSTIKGALDADFDRERR